MIYLDNASTTMPKEAVKNEVIKAMEEFGNPSSMHKLGINAENIIKKAKTNIASVLGVNADNIYFTSGGTESNNTAILGYVRANKKTGNHIITTSVEHPSVLTPFKTLENEGFKVTYLGTDKYGVINLEELENSLTPETIFVSIMHVNNETGAIMPIESIKGIMKRISPKAVLHVDAVQSFCKVPIKPKQWGIDMVSLSGHKIHGIKGCGALYIKENINMHPLLIGGGQQRGVRSGTENVVGISAISKACELMAGYDQNKIEELREYLKKGISENIPNVKFNESKYENQAGHILNVSFMGIKGEILLHSLEMHDIYVSTGSACSTNKPMPSHVLSAMDCTKEEINGAIRFSLCEDITTDDLDFVISALEKEVATIRRYVR